MIYYDIEQGSESWHTIRAGKFTGTSVKSLFMVVTTKGYNEAIAETVAEAITGTPTPSKDLDGIEAVARGKALEDYARKDFEEITGYMIREIGFIEHPELSEWLGISPDGIIEGERGIISGLEIKCPGPKAHLLYLTNGVLPKEYYYQVHTALFVTGADSWFFMSYHPEMQPFILRVERDEKIIEAIAEKVQAGIEKAKEMMRKYESYEYE